MPTQKNSSLKKTGSVLESVLGSALVSSPDPVPELVPVSVGSKLQTHQLFFFLLTLLFIFSLLTPIRLTTADLGRHIANGRELLAGHTQVLFQNHYSYTMPQQKFVNHHWLFGVLAFILDQMGGLKAMHLAYIITVSSAFWLLLSLIKNKAGASMAVLMGLPALLFLATRTEVRPEGFGLLLIVHTLWQLENIINSKKVKPVSAIALLVQQFIWTNLHISFVFGIFLPALLLGCSWVCKSPSIKNTHNKLLKLTLGLVAVSLINPNTILGLLEPFTILVDYGYSIVENQTLLFLFRQIGHHALIMYLLFQVVALPVVLISFKHLSWYEKALFLVGSFLGYLALRHTPIFVVLSFPVAAKAGDRV